MKLRRIEVAAYASVAAAVSLVAFPLSLAVGLLGWASLWPAAAFAAVLVASGAAIEWANTR